MNKEINKNSKGWLKNVLPNRTQNEALESEETLTPDIRFEETETEEQQPSVHSNKNHVLSKENQDKLSLDMILSLENMLNDRQLILYKNKSLEGQLETAHSITHRLQADIEKRDQLLLEKGEEIESLENSLTHKQMGYDQLLEDYKEYQQRSKTEFEDISSRLETEIQKYNKLKEDSTDNKYQDMLHIKQLEERIRDLEIDNKKFQTQYEQVLEEKSALMATINDFTERMSFSFSQKPATSNSDTE